MRRHGSVGEKPAKLFRGDSLEIRLDMKRLLTLPGRNQAAVLAVLLSTATSVRAQVASPAANPAPSPAAPQLAADEQLSDEAELARIVGLVGAARYEECAARLGKLLD